LPLRLSIQSKLLLMLLGVSLASIAVTGWLGYQNGKKALTDRVSEQLAAQRIARTTQLRSYFEQLRSQVLGLAENPMVAEAMSALHSSFRALEVEAPSNEQTQALQKFYEEEFLPGIASVSQGQPIAENFMPLGAAGRILQYHYIAANKYAVGNKSALDVAADGSAYSEAHAKYHPLLARKQRRFAYYDLFLIDADGNVVYTTQKETDFGADLTKGAHANTNLARAFRAARDANQRGYSKLVDYERYVPSQTAPASFMAAPIYVEKQMIGVVAVQVSNFPINAAMSGGNNWAREGLGQTGEVFLVAPDFRLRNDTRFLVEDPKKYAQTLTAAGVSAEQVNRIKTFKTSVLEQEVRGELARRALLNQTGELLTTDYRNVDVLGSYGPLGVDGLGWGVVAKMDAKEAYAPVRALARNVLIAAVLLQLLITFAALGLARLFLRPIEQLAAGAEEVGKGKLDTVVEVKTRDELHDLAKSFNSMAAKLKEQTEKTETTLKHNEALLLNILPSPIAKRLKSGEEQIADAVPSVTVLFARIEGFDEFVKQQAPDAAVSLLNELIGAFDETAENSGVEKVKSLGAAYLAVTGLNIPAIDHPRRMLEFARSLVQIVRGFNQRRGAGLRVRIGVNTGPVMAGVVGRSKFIYDLWGDTVSLAQALEHAGSADAVTVTEATYSRTRDEFAFERAADAYISGKGAQAVYRVTHESASTV
jgi:class 3 adenylate cyclase